MHPEVVGVFETILSRFDMTDKSVLEVGASPGGNMFGLESVKRASKKIGIWLGDPLDKGHFKIIQGNANNMKDLFDNESFDVVICNATLEHDMFFWRSVKEMRRVTRRGGVIVIGVPAYVGLKQYSPYPHFKDSTVTYKVHNHPGDYYRFSPQAVQYVLLEKLEDIEMFVVATPPRVIGYGIKPHIKYR